jgi:hypothetical protein
MADNEHEEDDDMVEMEGEGGDDISVDLRSQIILTMRQQNIELLQIAAQVAGYAKEHGPIKPDDARKALRTMWELYSEFYSWVDPEEAEGDDEEGDEE